VVDFTPVGLSCYGALHLAGRCVCAHKTLVGACKLRVRARARTCTDRRRLTPPAHLNTHARWLCCPLPATARDASKLRSGSCCQPCQQREALKRGVGMCVQPLDALLLPRLDQSRTKSCVRRIGLFALVRCCCRDNQVGGPALRCGLLALDAAAAAVQPTASARSMRSRCTCANSKSPSLPFHGPLQALPARVGVWTVGGHSRTTVYYRPRCSTRSSHACGVRRRGGG
jgi:hypothetical protein